MSNLHDSGGFSHDDARGGGTQTLDREPETRFPIQKVLVGGVVGILVIAVVVLGVYVSRQGKDETTTAVKTTTRNDVYDGIPVTVKDTGNIQENKQTMRVVSAKGDLTGQRELAWPADKGTTVGDAKCTQNFKFNAQAQPGIRPTLLICWRTSAGKSVYTVAVDIANKPSMTESVAILDKEWNAMG